MQSVGCGSLRSLNPLRVAHLGLLLSAFVPASTFHLAPRMVCGGIVVVGPDGVPRPGRPYVIPETPPTGDGSPLSDLGQLLLELDLVHLVRKVPDTREALFEFDNKLSAGRTEFLSFLKRAGVERLPDRQALANGLSRARKAGRLVEQMLPAVNSPPSPRTRLVVAQEKEDGDDARSSGERMLAKQNWAVIGDVLNPAKPASAVVERLKAAGKTVHLVNPRDSSGTCHKSIGDVGAALDVIDLIINPRDGLKQMTQAAELGVRRVFIQPGAGSAAILELCEQNAIEVHEGCVLREL